MRVDCTQCGKVIQIPPEKVPDRPFAFACPACQHRLKVEPPAAADAPVPVGATVAGSAPSPDVLEEVAPTSAVGQPEVAPLKTHERQLLATISPLAFIVELDAPTGNDLDASLEALGIQEIRRFQDLEQAIEQLLETEVGILVISVAKAAAPPFEPLEALAKIPSRMRRRIFVVLMAGNVKSLDGQVAFFLQVNCIINAGETQRHGGYLQRALLYHLKLYQHWSLDPS